MVIKMRDIFSSTKNEQGYTLVEMLAVVCIMGFLIAGLYDLLDAGIRNYETVDVNAEIQQSARAGLNDMVTTIRNSQGIEILNSSQIKVLTPAGEIKYKFESSDHTLKKKLPSDSFETLEKNIEALSFTSVTGLPTDRFIQIKLTTDKDGAQYTVQSSVYVPFK